MIMEKIAYGIHITDSFGNPRPGCEDLVAAIYEQEGEPIWLVKCYTDQAPQLLIGKEAKINKTTDFVALHNEWEALIQTIPQEILDLMAEAPLVEPDVDFMSGNY